MKEYVFNDTNLSDKDIASYIPKVRAIILNSKNEIMISNYAGIYMLPGGKINEDEDLLIALCRELKEELGITFEKNNFTPFMVVQQYIQNYPLVEKHTTENRLWKTVYFIIYSDLEISKDKSLSEKEKRGKLITRKYPIEDILKRVSMNNTENPRKEYFDRELLIILKKVKEQLRNIERNKVL